MESIDLISLVVMQQNRLYYEKKVYLQELEKLEKELVQIFKDLKIKNEEKGARLSLEVQRKFKLIRINDRFRKHINLLDDYHILLNERTNTVQEKFHLNSKHYVETIKKYTTIEEKQLEIYEQFPMVNEQQVWTKNLNSLRIQVAMTQYEMFQQHRKNYSIKIIQQQRLQNAIINFVKRVIYLKEYYARLESAKKDRDTLVIRIKLAKEKISSQHLFSTPVLECFEQKVDAVSNMIESSSSWRRWESKFMEKLSKLTVKTKVPNIENYRPASNPNKGIEQYSKRKRDIIEPTIKVKNTTSQNRSLSINETNQKQIEKQEVQVVTVVQEIETVKETVTVPNSSNVTDELANDPIIIHEENESVELPFKKAKGEQRLPKVLSVEVIRPPQNQESNSEASIKSSMIMPKFTENALHITNQNVTFDVPTNEQPEVSEISTDNISFNTNYNHDVESARFHLSSILERSPEYNIFHSEGIVSPSRMSLSSPPLSVENVRLEIPPAENDRVEVPAESGKVSFSLFGKKSPTKKAEKSSFFGNFF